MDENQDNDFENDNDYDREQQSRKINYRKGRYDTEKLLWRIRLKFWYTGSLLMVVMIYLIMIGSIATPRWAEQGKGGEKWRTGLLKCGGCQGIWENTYISSIVQDAQDNNINGYLTTFKNLRNGAYFYVLFESITLALCTLWIIHIWGMLLKRRIFSFYVLFIILTLILIMHTIALAGWFGFTGASFSQTCDNISNYQQVMIFVQKTALPCRYLLNCF